jgi:predicted transcriptional regulator
MLATQIDSNNMTKKEKRYKQIISVLEHFRFGMTAREIATALGYVERNATSPRLTELVKQGRVKEFGTKYDSISNRNVTTYVLLDKTEQIRMGVS